MSGGDESRRRAVLISEGLNCIGVLAVPHLQPAEGAPALREGVSEAIRELLRSPTFFNAMIPDRGQLKRFLKLLEDLGTRLAEGASLDKEPITSLARSVLAAFGIPEPPGGWDAYRPPPEED